MLSQPNDRHVSVQKDVTEWRRKELASAVASAVRQMDRMDGLELPESEYEKLATDLMARKTFMASAG